MNCISGKTLAISIPSLIAFLALLFFLSSLFGNPEVIQPIGYNHKIHIESAGLDCKDCHINSDKLASASIPGNEICQNCHSESPLSESPEEAKLLRYLAESKEVPWVQINTVPDHVYFSHRRHVVGGELECNACHGNVGEMTEPFSKPAIPITMENCMNCHKQRNVSNDCLACHR